MKMKTIWKFPLEPLDVQDVLMPEGAQILCVQMQGDNLYLWALVQPDAKLVKRAFRIFGTGHPVPADLEQSYIGTIQVGGGALVFHVFRGLGD